MTKNKRTEQLRLQTAAKRAAKKKEAVIVAPVKKKIKKVVAKKVLTEEEKEIEKIYHGLLNQEAYMITVLSYRGTCKRQCGDCRYFGCQHVIVFSASFDLREMISG